MQPHSEIGVIATTPGGDVFFGFNGSVKGKRSLDSTVALS
jgi:hypothetical protein